MIEPTPKSLPAVLVALRRSRGLSQARAAERAGVSPMTWGEVERGNREAERQEVDSLLSALDATAEERGEVAAAYLADVAQDVRGWAPVDGEG